MGVRHAEFEAIADVFLGADYDPLKRKHVENLQILLDQKEIELARQHDRGEIGDLVYVEAVNAAMEDTLEQCEAILGLDDFHKLFGGSRQELAGLIDPEIFPATDDSKEAKQAKRTRPSP
jgi:hypothetical protein